jgi:hypothetical protein
MNFCKYRHILGVEKKGFHKKRIFGFALNDILGTIIIASLYGYYANINIIKSNVILFLIAIILHKIFCVKTTLNNLIFDHN